MQWPKARQIRAHRKYAELAYDYALQELIDNRAKIIALSLKRLAGPGFDMYQDQSFKLTKAQLKKGRLEEYADAVNYKMIELTLERGLE